MVRSQRRVPCADLDANPPALLTGEHAHRLCRVLRLGSGDEVEMFDGRGGSRPARLVSSAPDEVRLEWCGPRRAGAPAVAFRIGAAVPKGKRAEVMVEKLCELGAARIVLLLTERGVVRPEADGTKARRWAAIAEEAARQCRRDDVPEVEGPITVGKWLASLPAGIRLYHAHPIAPALGPRELLAELGAHGTGGTVALAVGPEGGWSDAELAQLAAAGSRAVHLGPRILRIETAAITLAALAQAGAGGLEPSAG